MENNKIAAVVVTYNRKEMLKECIQALLKQSFSQFDILIIDNCSSDGTDKIVEEFMTSGRVKYKNTKKNLGGAGGFQYGVREALKGKYDYLWLMDDDSIPTTDALKALVEEAQKLPSFGFLSSKVLWKDRSLCKMNIPKVTLNHKLNNFDEMHQIIMATFVSFFVSAKTVREVGLPIKEFFIWADDLEYSRRISLKYKSYFVPSSVIIHKCKSNNGSNIVTDSIDRLPRYKYAYRNEVYVYRREGIPGWIHLTLKTCLHICKVALKSKNEKKKRLSIIINSTREGLKFNPEIEYYK